VGYNPDSEHVLTFFYSPSSPALVLLASPSPFEHGEGAVAGSPLAPGEIIHGKRLMLWNSILYVYILYIEMVNIT